MVTINEDDLLYRMEDGAYTYNHEPFTGISREYNIDGALVGEAAYVNGVQEGPARYWYPSGELLREEVFFRNGLHGPVREWRENGQLQREAVFEHSIRVSDKQWDEKGNLVEDYVLTQDNPAYSILQDFRKIYGVESTS